MLTLEVKPREGSEAAESLREEGVVPAVFYGPKEETTSITIYARKLEHVWKEAGETTIVTLKGIGDDKETLIHDAQVHPISGKLVHVDFYVLEKGKKVEISVPLEFTGVAPAEKAGHIIVKALHEIDIEVAPHELPHLLSVDLSSLVAIGDHIVARDVALPSSAELLTKPEEIVASVKEFKEEAEEIAPAPETEIIGKEAAPDEEAEGPAEAPDKEEKKEA